MILELDTGLCASEEVVFRRGVDTRRCASKDTRPRRGGGFGGVPRRLEKETSAGKNAGPRRG